MSAIAYTRFVRAPSGVLEEVIDTGEPAFITRADGRDLVLMPACELESILESAHLLSGKNRDHLLESLRQYEHEELVEIAIQ